MPPKKETKQQDQVVEWGFPVLVAIFIFIIWSAILNYLFLSRFGSYAGIWDRFVAWFMRYLWPIILVVCIIAIILSIAGIIYNWRRLEQISEEEEKIYGAVKDLDMDEEPVTNKNEKWERVIGHMNSANASDWRIAVIEADIMLDEMLRTQGYHGDSVGDMLKGVDKSDMLTLENAWEAHKTRNLITHSGTEYYLTEREAKRVLGLYETVFKEFEVI